VFTNGTFRVNEGRTRGLEAGQILRADGILLNPDGSVMTVAQMQAAGYTSAQIQQIESTLSGGLTLNTTTLLLIGGAVLLFVVMSKKG